MSTVRSAVDTRRRDVTSLAVIRRAVLVVVGGVAGAACTSDHQIMNGSGKGSEQISDIGWFMIVLAGIIAVFFLSLLGWALFRGGRRNAWKNEKAVVVVGGILLPVAVIAALTVLTLTTLKGRSEPTSLTVEVTGHQYWWEVHYPADGVTTANEFTIPVGEPVDIVLTSDDVIHSFWVPDLDGKIDMVPGHTNHLIVTARKPGRYRGQCAEYCGLQHARMAFIVDAVQPEEYRDWLARQAAEADEPASAVERSGLRAFTRLPCASCHTIRGTAATGTAGPDLTHLASRRTLGAGVVPNDRGHLGGWISNSQTIKPGNLMPAIPLAPAELQGLIAYLEGLR